MGTDAMECWTSCSSVADEAAETAILAHSSLRVHVHVVYSRAGLIHIYFTSICEPRARRVPIYWSQSLRQIFTFIAMALSAVRQIEQTRSISWPDGVRSP